MFEFGMVKLVILLLMGPFIEFDCSRYRCSSERFFLLRNIGKIDWTFKSVRAIHGIRGTEVWLYYVYSDKNNRLPFRSFGPYNIFLVTDRSMYCHMTLSAMNYLLYSNLLWYRILRTIGRYFFFSTRWLRPIVHIDLYKDEVKKIWNP